MQLCSHSGFEYENMKHAYTITVYSTVYDICMSIHKYTSFFCVKLSTFMCFNFHRDVFAIHCLILIVNV